MNKTKKRIQGYEEWDKKPKKIRTESRHNLKTNLHKVVETEQWDEYDVKCSNSRR